jgi:hypothetical protein
VREVIHSAAMPLGLYALIVTWLLIAWMIFGVWRITRKRGAVGPAMGSSMAMLMDDNRRAAIEIIVEERTGERDPEDRDGDLPQLEHHER